MEACYMHVQSVVILVYTKSLQLTIQIGNLSLSGVIIIDHCRDTQICTVEKVVGTNTHAVNAIVWLTAHVNLVVPSLCMVTSLSEVSVKN